MRVGFVDISYALLQEEKDFFNKRLPDVKVISSTKMFPELAGIDIIRYYCECEEFDDINIGDTIPRYIFTWERKLDGLIVRLPVKRIS